jgi:hypothetical protein
MTFRSTHSSDYVIYLEVITQSATYPWATGGEKVLWVDLELGRHEMEIHRLTSWKTVPEFKGCLGRAIHPWLVGENRALRLRYCCTLSHLLCAECVNVLKSRVDNEREAGFPRTLSSRKLKSELRTDFEVLAYSQPPVTRKL